MQFFGIHDAGLRFHVEATMVAADVSRLKKEWCCVVARHLRQYLASLLALRTLDEKFISEVEEAFAFVFESAHGSVANRRFRLSAIVGCVKIVLATCG